jgi:hypothetical protein
MSSRSQWRSLVSWAVIVIGGILMVPLATASPDAPRAGDAGVFALGDPNDPAYIPPYIDAMDGIQIKGAAWAADPASWPHSTTITVKGAQYGVSEATVKLRIEGKGDPIQQSVPQQTMLVYDNSGSMSSSDPNGLRCPAMQYYIDQLTVPSEIGGVAFESTAAKTHDLSTNYASVKAALQCPNLGSTNQHQALTLANDETIPKKKAGFVQAHILLTDGYWNSGGDPQPQVDRAQQENIRLYTICLGSFCNTAEMQGWAQQTGGKYYQVSSAADLQQVYKDIANSLSNDVAGKPPKTGAPMLKFRMTNEIEVVPNSFKCDSTSCATPAPTNPAVIVANNKGLALDWAAPVKELRIKQYWQIEFGVRSYKIGKQIKVNDVAQSYVEYDRYDGSPGGSDVFEQLYVDVTPDVPGIGGAGIAEPPSPPPPPPHGGIPQLIPQPQQIPITYIQNLPVLHGVTQVQGIPLQYLLGSAMGMAVADRVKMKSRIKQGVKIAMASM